MIANKPINGGEICSKCTECCKHCASHLGYYKPEWLRHCKNFPGESISDTSLKSIMDVRANIGCTVLPSYIEKMVKVLRQEWAPSVNFDVVKGFNSSSGCTIPRQFRSAMCLRYACTIL
jgi:hypothetical protein